MKAAGKSKDELKPMIATLLDLKKQLAVLKGEEVNSVGNEKANKNSTKSQGSGKKKKEKK